MQQDNFTPLDLTSMNGHAKPNVESEPVAGSSEHFEIAEIVEHKPEHDVSEHVTTRLESVEIDQEAAATGAVSTAQIKFPAEEKIKLPYDMTDNQIEQGLHKPVTNSWRWLAEFCKYLLKQAHITLKMIHGKVVRIVSK